MHIFFYIKTLKVFFHPFADRHSFPYWKTWVGMGVGLLVVTHSLIKRTSIINTIMTAERGIKKC